MDERMSLRLWLDQYNLTQSWLIDVMRRRGLEVDKATLSGTLKGTIKNNRAGVEIYQSSRYFIMTGNVLLFREVAENQAALDYVVETYFPETQKEGGSTSVPQRIYTPIYKRPESGKVRLSPEYPPILPGCRNLSLTSLAGQLHNQGYGAASGCGYDKESAAIAEALNQSPAVLKVLYTLKEKGLKRPPAQGRALNPFHPQPTREDRRSSNSICGYGAGYGVLPYFEGGVGSSCFWSILEKCGYTCRNTASGKWFDAYSVEPKQKRKGA